MKYKDYRPQIKDNSWELNWFEGCVSFMPEIYFAHQDKQDDLIYFGEYEVLSTFDAGSHLKILLKKQS